VNVGDAIGKFNQKRIHTISSFIFGIFIVSKNEVQNNPNFHSHCDYYLIPSERLKILVVNQKKKYKLFIY